MSKYKKIKSKKSRLHNKKKSNFLDTFKKYESTISLILGIVSILIVIIFDKGQLDLERQSKAPVFYMSQVEILDFNKVYKLENKGGDIYHVKFELVTELSALFDNIVIEEEIVHSSKDIIEELNSKEKNVWYIVPIFDDIDISILEKRIKKSLQSLSSNTTMYINSVYSFTYYRITYHDYENIKRIDYYSFRSDGTGEFSDYRNSDEYKKTDQNPQLFVRSRSYGYTNTKGYKSTEQFYTTLSKIIYEHVLLYNN